ncbi:SAM-dependent methyltransferase [Leuconostoc sp. LN180020]|uniref:SAM-dependent methyltransferase n=1 Tax=Leuconostoc sp. LN180020 TaxID=2571156 RepID=UPI00177A97DE|nr:SAM-dependent methyltransferase [Leuconostoc sp. LN180020]QOG10986.1 SAM-dependent methyltransferase [Leuconostoc sp. LN180020]
MIPSIETLAHQLIEQTVKVGDIVIDGTTANGINTRFLATRVGKSGKVLSYTATKDNANATAASLFMSGLSERVTLLGKTLDRYFLQEIGSQSQASIGIFDYSDDAQNKNQYPNDYTDQINRVLPRLKHGGLMLIKFQDIPTDWLAYLDTLIKADYTQATYRTKKGTLFIIERI